MIRIEGIPIVRARLMATLRISEPSLADAGREALPPRVKAIDRGVEADQTLATTVDRIAA
jgi:hypothetical protein